jgi:hypothetical protein
MIINLIANAENVFESGVFLLYSCSVRYNHGFKWGKLGQDAIAHVFRKVHLAAF